MFMEVTDGLYGPDGLHTTIETLRPETERSIPIGDKIKQATIKRPSDVTVTMSPIGDRNPRTLV